MEEVAVEPSGISSCPSFNSYYSDRIVRELEEGLNHHHPNQDTEEDDRYDDFEFFPVARDVPDDGFVISSDKIRPVFPVFNRDLLLANGYGINGLDSRSNGGGGGEVRSIEIPLMDLFMEEDNDPLSSEADNEIKGIPEGSYCVWTPRDSVQSSPSWGKKSNSTGSRSSRRWRFLDLLRRSNSDGKDSFMFLTPSSNRNAKLVEETRNSTSQVRISSSSERSGNNGKLTSGVAAAERRKGKSTLEVFYTRTRSQVVIRGKGNRRKSYLPYRQDLVGFFANINNLGRAFPPFARV